MHSLKSNDILQGNALCVSFIQYIVIMNGALV